MPNNTKYSQTKENQTLDTDISVLREKVKKQHRKINGISLAYRDTGSGPTLFFLHGMNGESGSWLYQLAGLSRFYRVISWDAPGYGGSETIGSTISELAQTAFSLLDELEAEKPLIIGHSMGGVIAGRMAIEKPDKISGLVLSCTHWGWAHPIGEALIDRYTKRINELHTMSIDEFTELRASRMTAKDAPSEVVAFLAEMSRAVSIDALKNVGRANQEADNLPGLNQLKIPIYLLYAEFDRVIKQERTDAFI
ncbi:MAG: alpha/beta hydrolase, partial [Spirochaetia bacterium]|nr:alpha/beta hydrolase [Spirochaetia bacterium]